MERADLLIEFSSLATAFGADSKRRAHPTEFLHTQPNNP
jgi:hypothetical protein